jgi:hypothetical protein
MKHSIHYLLPVERNLIWSDLNLYRCEWFQTSLPENLLDKVNGVNSTVIGIFLLRDIKNNEIVKWLWLVHILGNFVYLRKINLVSLLIIILFWWIKEIGLNCISEAINHDCKKVISLLIHWNDDPVHIENVPVGLIILVESTKVL